MIEILTGPKIFPPLRCLKFPQFDLLNDLMQNLNRVMIILDALTSEF